MDATFYQGPSLVTELDAVTGAAAPTAALKFFTTTAVAAAVAGTASVPILYNPPGSGVVARIMAVRFGAVAGTVIAGNLVYGWLFNPTLTGLTAGPNPVNGFLGRGNSTPLLWYTTATSAAAPNVMGTAGISAGGAYAAGPLFQMFDPVNGFIVLPPNTAFWPYLANAAVAMTALITVDVIQTPMLTNY